MVFRKRNLLVLLSAVAVAFGLLITGGGGTGVAQAFNPSHAPRVQTRLLDGLADMALGFQSPQTATSPPVHGSKASNPAPNYFPAANGQCPVRLANNVKVNQSCLNVTAPDLQGRGQAENETTIAVNPTNPNQLLAASNDYILGDGLAGGIAFSRNGGQTWQNSTVPLEFTRGSDFPGDPYPRMYWQGGGDPSVAWDTHGDAYFAGLHFNRGNVPAVGGVSDNPDYSSAVYVYRSTANGGASWDFPGTAVTTSFQPVTPPSGVPLDDKPYMTIDDHPDQFQNRIYVTWTLFAADGTAYIYEAHSSDYGRTFSTPVVVSTNSSLCPNNYVSAGVVPENGNNCDENQYSDPFTGPDGTLYVVYSNFNNATTSATDNHNQVLLTKSTDGGATFSAPVQVAKYNDLPDCATYQGGQDLGRACVPEKGAQQNSVFRATNYPSGSVSAGNVVAVTFGSYINADSNPSNGCVPAGVNPATGGNLYVGVKTPGACSNKILLSVSTDQGASFTGTGQNPRTDTVVPQSRAQAHTDQWWQWSTFTPRGVLAVSYYDRQYGADETNGNMDITLSSSANLAKFRSTRVTSSSMPTPTMFPDAQGNSLFFGDYSGLAAGRVAYPLWSDTRLPDLFDCGTNPPAVCIAVEPDGVSANAETIFTSGVPAVP